MTEAPSSPRPPLALRIGVTGARSLRADQTERIARQLDALFAAVAADITALQGDPRLREAYAETPAGFLFVSPLARGGDRLAARVALAHGYTLHVPMPFPLDVYRTDFDGAEKDCEPPLTAAQDLAEFEALLDQAAGRFELDGDKKEQQGRSYAAVGRFVVRHCSLLIAIWDGRPGHGQGGTAEIVRVAAGAGLPVWWIHATEDRPPVWIADIQDVRDPPENPAPAGDQLRAYLRAEILPPLPASRHQHTWIEGLAGWRQPATVSPEKTYFTETPRPQRWVWRAYRTLMCWASGHGTPWSPPNPPTDAGSLAWFRRYQPADDRAAEYAARYRSSYVWVFGLATLALVFGALALASGALEWSERAVLDVAGLELLALLAITLLVVASVRREWHERSIEYRLLAELCRKQSMLAPLGWALPATAVHRMATADRAAWVGWLFAAWQRATPPAAGPIDLAERVQEVTALIDEQIAYHAGRRDMSRGAGNAFVRLGALTFGAVLLCVGIKVAATAQHWPHDIALRAALFATILPGLSAAFVGIRAYAELQLLVEQSRYMLAELEHARARIARLRPGRPFAAQDLGTEAAQVATLMLEDLEGWARLFRVKGVEPG